MRLNSQKGSIIILVLGILGLSAILVSALVQLVEVANKQTAISRDMIRYRTVLDSLLDYSIHGIKQRWCFTDKMLEDTCGWAHPASAERLVMNDNVVRALGEVVQDNPAFPAAPPFRLDKIDITVPITDISSAHPLFRAIQPAQSVAFTNVRFEMWRVSNIYIAQHGEETMVGVRVTLNSTTTLFRGLTSLTATSMIMVFPRQLNQFSLVVPRDMRMDTGSATSAVGDANIVVAGSRSGSGAGLVFESPVFVNRNLHIPPSSRAADPPYAPVTFAQRVVVGDGRVFENTDLMVPASPGGEISRTYDQTSGIGGFLRGIEIDGAPDQGLNVFAGLASPPVPPTNDMDECRDYMRSQSDLSITKNSPLYVQQSTDPWVPGLSLAYNLALGGNNSFYPQRVNAKITGRSYAPATGPRSNGGWRVAPAVSNTDPAIGYVFATFGAATLNFFQAYMAKSTTVSATFIAAGAAPKFSITLEPVTRFGSAQPNEMRLVVSVEPGGDFTAIPSPIRVYFKAFDYAHNNGADRRKPAPINTFDIRDLREANFRFIPVAAGLEATPYSDPLTATTSHQVKFGTAACPGVLPLPIPPPEAAGFSRGSACSGVGTGTGIVPRGTVPFSNLPPAATTDYAMLQTKCNKISSERGTAMGMADWSTANFVAGTRNSWNFRPLDPALTIAPPYPAPAVPELVFDATTDNTFEVRSIVGRCRISAAATTVQALIGCDEFVIDSRGSPLTISGTVIAGKTTISPGALSAGIRWRSLRHPQAVYDLRNNVTLMSQHNFVTPCGGALGVPEFSPAGSIVDISTQQACNPLKFATAADPFNWSSVDPDCGVMAGAAYMSCKRRPLRYIVREISRISD